MTKILLVEDDKSLREIYGVRLLAEGYDIVSAGDGEEALAMAIKEKPLLIISDVMMPKISGFDMLDILRSTTETKNIKVIMMTALSSDDQRARGEQLGADRYLVKSQVGIEDVVRTVHEILGDGANGQAQQIQADVNAAPPVADAPVAPSAEVESAAIDSSAPEVVSEPLAVSPPMTDQPSTSDSDILPSSVDVGPLSVAPEEPVNVVPETSVGGDPGPLPPQPTETAGLDALPSADENTVLSASQPEPMPESPLVPSLDSTAPVPSVDSAGDVGPDVSSMTPDLAAQSPSEAVAVNEGLNFDAPQADEAPMGSVSSEAAPEMSQPDITGVPAGEATTPSDVNVSPGSLPGPEAIESTDTTNQSAPTQ
jgi:CheY-like chemotaxis protein